MANETVILRKALQLACDEISWEHKPNNQEYFIEQAKIALCENEVFPILCSDLISSKTFNDLFYAEKKRGKNGL